MMVRFVLIFFLVAALLSSLSCRSERPAEVDNSSPEQAYGGFLRIATQSPESLDPIHSKNYAESEIVLQLFDGLLRFDQNLNIAPALAQDWQVSSDGRNYTFHLRKGVHFHNGREVTAEDFVYSLTRLLDPRWKSVDETHYSKILGANEYREGKARSIEGLKALDPLTLRITLEETYAPFLRILAQQPASVVPREEVERRDLEFGKRPVGTGAYRFSQWDPAGEILLSANPDYFEGRPFLQGIRIKTLSTLNAHDNFQDFLDRKLDISFVPSGQLPVVHSRADWVYVSRPILRFMYLGINLKDRMMRDVNIRKAIHYAINKSEVVGEEPDYSITNNLIPLSLLGSNPEANPDLYNLEAARQALALSGLHHSRRLKINLWHATNFQERKKLLARLANNLQAVGMEVDLRIVPSLRELLEKIYSGQTQLFLIGEVIDFPDPDALLNRLFNSKSKGNPFAYKNVEVDRLLLEAQTTLDEHLRAQLYGKIEKQILEDHVMIPLFLAKCSFVTHKNVQGIEVNPLGFQYLPFRKVWLQALR
jgi:oligopeptide transport system substrate-binding protein